MDGGSYLVLAVTLFIAVTLQSSIGFGAGMVAAPVISFLDPALLPGFIICLGAVVGLMVSVRERASLDLRGTGWALAGRIPGSILGAWIVVAIPSTVLAWGIALSVVIGVCASFSGWMPKPRRVSVLFAGALSGVMGTATAIGGTPMAIIWQGQEPAKLRGTMSAFFMISSMISLALLGVAGALTLDMVTTLLWMMPVAILGFVASHQVNRLMNSSRLRILALSLSIFGALLLIVRLVFSS